MTDLDAPAALELCFLVAPGQHGFLVDLAGALVDEMTQLGVRARIERNGYRTPDWGTVYVVVGLGPHRLHTGFEPLSRPDLLARTILIGAEDVSSEQFDVTVATAEHAGMVFDLDHRIVDAFNARSIRAAPLALGYTRLWDRAGAVAERDIDTLVLGPLSPRRAKHLSGAAEVLWRRRTMLVLSDEQRPDPRTTPHEERLALLGRAQTVLSIHADDDLRFDWSLAIEAMHCGAVVIAETATDYMPLVAGTHYLSADIASLPAVVDAALVDAALVSRIRADAFAWLRANPLARTAERIVDAALELIDRPVPDKGAAYPEHAIAGPPPYAPRRQSDSEDASVIRQALKEIRLDLFDMKREMKQVADHGGRAPAPEVVWQSAAYRAATQPRVSVLTALYQHAEHITTALASVHASTFHDVEVIVVDDGSSDGSSAAVVEFATAHPDLALLLVRHPVNRGLGHARNTALGFARGEIAFILDADNALLPTGLATLVGALDDDPGAALAYGVLECFSVSGPSHIVSYLPWEPERFRAGNYVDAMAAIRVSELRSAGGFTTDRRLYGWEDYDLWCGLAGRGAHGVLVPNFVGRYRVSPTSMLVTSNFAHFSAYAALVERHPQLMEGVQPPQ